jgi:hypothetical protein
MQTGLKRIQIFPDIASRPRAVLPTLQLRLFHFDSETRLRPVTRAEIVR